MLVPTSLNQLFEIGEGNLDPYKFELVRDNLFVKTYIFTTEDRDDYRVNFSQIFKENEEDDTNIWELNFKIKNSDFSEVSNRGRIFKVMSTITNIVKQFAAVYDPKEIIISNIGDDLKRYELYSKFLEKNKNSKYLIYNDYPFIYIKRKIL
jgi:hypothetical protein